MSTDTEAPATAASATSAVSSTNDGGPASSTTEPIGATATSTTSTTAAAVTSPLQMCSDVPVVETDVLGDDPSGTGLDPAFHGVLLSYARDHVETFGGMWLDREANGTMVLAFTDDPVAHRQALALRAPSADDVHPIEPMPPITDTRPIGEWGVAFDVVQVSYTEAQLVQGTGEVLNAINELGLGSFGGGAAVMRNRISIYPPQSPTVAEAQTIAGALGSAGLLDMVCLDGEIVDARPDPIAPGTPLNVIVLPDEDGTYPPDTPVECGGGASFTLGDLQTLTPIEDADPGLQAVLTGWINGPAGAGLPADGWVVLTQSDDAAMLARISEQGMAVIGAQIGRNGWIWSSSSAGGGSCDVARRLPEGLGPVSWIFDPAFPAPDPMTTDVHVLVTEMACAGGAAPGERLLGPQVVETDAAVRIAFAVVPLTGAQPCPSNPATPVTITLEQPLGARALLDGLTIGPLLSLVEPTA